MRRVLIVDRDRALREALAHSVRAAGFEADALATSAEVWQRDGRSYSALLFDVANAADARALDALVRRSPTLVAIAMGSGEPRGLVLAALRAGARDYLRKPFPIRALERALATVGRDPQRASGGPELLRADPKMESLLREADALARTDATLELIGEPGSGRRRLARFVHSVSGRRAAPFLVVDCESLGGALAARELFGDEGGARARRGGSLEGSAGGTLVLVEPGLLDAKAQARLLAALLAGTSADASVSERRLLLVTREALRDDERLSRDLRLRLDVLALTVPPLRERPADIELLARVFLERHAHAAGLETPQLGSEALAALCARRWPGNVRELESLMHRAALLFAGREVDVDALLRGRLAAAATRSESLDLRALERRAVERSLDLHRGNRTHAARALGISVRTLRNKIREYALAGPGAVGSPR